MNFVGPEAPLCQAQQLTDSDVSQALATPSGASWGEESQCWSWSWSSGAPLVTILASIPLHMHQVKLRLEPVRSAFLGTQNTGLSAMYTIA